MKNFFALTVTLILLGLGVLLGIESSISAQAPVASTAPAAPAPATPAPAATPAASNAPAAQPPAQAQATPPTPAPAAVQPAAQPAASTPSAAPVPTATAAPTATTPAQPSVTPAANVVMPKGPVASIVDLQPFRKTLTLTNATNDSVSLTNLNPNVSAWYLLETNLGGKKNSYHLEVFGLKENLWRKPVLTLYPDGLAVVLSWKTVYFPLWSGPDITAKTINVLATPSVFDSGSKPELNPSPQPSEILKNLGKSKLPYSPACDGMVLVRTQLPGSMTKMEYATDVLRQSKMGDWLVEAVKPYLLEGPELVNSMGKSADNHYTADAAAPIDAKVQGGDKPPSGKPKGLGIKTDAKGDELVYGRWYRAQNHPGVYVSVMVASAIDSSVMETYKDRVDKFTKSKQDEAHALVYLAAFDLAKFKLGFTLGADHPEVGWSPRVVNKPANQNGPDGFSTRKPLVSIGCAAPYMEPFIEATFVGGFKRLHGAFQTGPLSKVNLGSHFGFAEQGVIFSRLQPSLATLFIHTDGVVDMFTWTDKSDAQLQNLWFARQNCPPLIEGIDDKGVSIPGDYVNKWGEGAWSGSQNGDFLTQRSSVALQEKDGHRFLIFGYFTGATPNAMARVFQAYQVRYAMLLDMNAYVHCFLALHQRDEKGAIVTSEYLHVGMADADRVDKAGHRFLQTDDTRDFFYVYK